MKIRLSRNLKEQIELAATDANRTLNGEIVARLERTFIEDGERATAGVEWIKRAQRLSVNDTVARLDAHEIRIAELERQIRELKA